jgi:HAD superfamily hydrolase (TIGR01509 family)
MIKALLFDFDGLILDTETPDVLAWQDIYASYGATFPVESWGAIVGGSGGASFDAARHLQSLTGTALDPQTLQARQNELSHALVYQQPVLPGVAATLAAARERGLHLAVASSSPHSWVDAHLERLGLRHWFDVIVCGDDVAPGRVKPHPDLYRLALERLALTAGQAIVFEDSPNGVAAARAAGIFVIAVPNPTTTLLKFNGEDLRLRSFTDLSLTEVLARFEVE